MAGLATTAATAGADLVLKEYHAGLWWPLVSRYLEAANRQPLDDESLVLGLLHRLPYDALTALEYPLRSEDRPALPDISQRIETPSQVEFLVGACDRPWAKMLRDWSRARQLQTSGHLAKVEAVWLEFDLRRTEQPEPLLCLYLPPDDRNDLLAWLDLLPGGPHRDSRPQQAATVQRAHKAAPSGASLMYLFDLSARDPGSIRLEWFGVTLAEMAPFLDRLGSPTPTWWKNLPELIGDGRRLHFSFDIRSDGTLGDRIGIETSFAKLPPNEPRWGQLFKRLIDGGLSDPQALDSIQRWLGQDRSTTAGALWPPQSELADGHLARVLSHVKVVGKGQEDPIAKTYLLFRYLAERPVKRSA